MQQLLSESPKVRVLLIARQLASNDVLVRHRFVYLATHMSQNGAVVTLGGLPLADSVEVLLRLAPSVPSLVQHAVAIAELVECLPVALNIIGRWITSGHAPEAIVRMLNAKKLESKYDFFYPLSFIETFLYCLHCTSNVNLYRPPAAVSQRCSYWRTRSRPGSASSRSRSRQAWWRSPFSQERSMPRLRTVCSETSTPRWLASSCVGSSQTACWSLMTCVSATICLRLCSSTSESKRFGCPQLGTRHGRQCSSSALSTCSPTRTTSSCRARRPASPSSTTRGITYVN